MMLQKLFYLFIILFLFLVILWYFLKLPYIIKLRNIPGPTPLPIIGNVHNISSNIRKTVPSLLELKKKYGKVYKIFIGFEDIMVVATDHLLLEKLLGGTSEITKSHIYTFFHRWLGLGLLTANAQKWKKQRRIITPAFHFKILESFLDVFHKNEKVCIKQLENELHGNSFNLFNYISFLTLDNIIETSMGTEINAQIGGNTEYVECTVTIMNLLLSRQFSFIESNEFLYQFTKTKKVEERCLKVLHGLTDRVIQERKNETKNKKNEKNKEDGTGIRNKLAFLDLLMESTIDGRPLTEKELRDEVDTFMFEGHDTTASGISFVLYCLSKNPDVQARVVDEIRSVLGEEKESNHTLSDYQNLPYLEAVIKEGMRCYPTVPTIMRETKNDFEYNGVKYPNGTTIQILIYGVLQDPELFPNPKKFDPERFLGSTNHHPYAFIPFSAGPRNCIGQRFAMLEMKSTIVSFLKHYEILEVKDTELELTFGSVIKSANGIPVRIRKRRSF